jgi:fibronectin type 3 domain-containing protein
MMIRRIVLWYILVALLLVSAASAATVTLAWDAPGDPDLAGYRLYRCSGTACTPSVMLIQLGLVTTYQDTTISLGTIYRYRITAIDAVPNESAVSNTIEIGPPPTPTGVIAR